MGNQSIQSFIDGFNGGTRLNRFTVDGNIGSNNSGIIFTDFHIKSTTLPEAILGAITVNYRGRSVSYPGDRAYKPWEIVVIDDTGANNNLYSAFHRWHEQMNSHDTNLTSNNIISPKTNFATNWAVTQYDTNGNIPIKKFSIKNCWPIGIGPFQLDMGQDNSIGAFAVTMVYSHYTTTL